MGINFAYERKKFIEKQEKLRKEYEAAGMTKEQIMAMYVFDLHQFNRDIAYKRHTQQLSNLEESDMEVYWSISAQIIAQIREKANGTVVDSFSIN